MDENDCRTGRLQRLADGVHGLGMLALMLLAPLVIAWWASKAELPSSAGGDSRHSSAQSAQRAPAAIRALALSADGQYLDTLRGDTTWQRHDAHTGQILGDRILSREPLKRVSLRSDDGIVVGLKSGVELEIVGEAGPIWSERLPELQPDDHIAWCAVARERNLAAIVSNQGSLWLLEFANGELGSQRHYALDCAVGYIELSQAGDYAAMVTNEARLLIWDVAQERIAARQTAADGATHFVKWSGDGRQLLTFGYGREARVWQTDTLELLESWQVESQSVQAGGFSASGRLAAIAENDVIRIRDVADQREVAVLTGHRGMVSALQFADQDRTLFSGDTYGELRRWSVSDEREVWSAQ